jgi:hypothetical protein
MKWKLVSAFATGAVLASGIVYFAVKPLPTVEEPKRVAFVEKPTPEPLPHPSPAPLPVQAEAPAAAPVHGHVPVREKRSPFRPLTQPPIQHDEPLPVAKAIPPAEPLPTAPPPQPAPVVPPVVKESVPVQNVSLPAPVPETRVPHTVTLAAGTLLPVRIGESLSAVRNQPGDTFLATLTQPLVIDGWVIAERGARVEGRVLDSTHAGRVKGASHLEISIVRLATADGQNIRIRTEPYSKEAASSTGTDAAKIGGGAAIGAIIGALAGGGKGAAIGAGAGGAVGAGDVMLTRGKAAEIPVETRVSFKVQDSVTITERID